LPYNLNFIRQNYPDEKWRKRTFKKPGESFYFLKVRSEGSKYPFSLIVARSILRQTYQVKGTDIRGVTVKERRAKASHPDKVAGLCLHPTKKTITRKKPIRNKISSYVI
jgi:hypothetical protein